MKPIPFESYRETRHEHQYPVIALSAWQEWNDLGWADWFTQREEETDTRITAHEQKLFEHSITQSLFDYSCQ